MEIYFKIPSYTYSAQFVTNVNWAWQIHFFIHNNDDFPDAINLQNQFVHIINAKFVTGAKLKNRHITRVSTRAKPCQKYWPKSCHDVYKQKKIAKEFGCQIRYFNTGVHPNQSFLPNCTGEVVMEIMSR